MPASASATCFAWPNKGHDRNEFDSTFLSLSRQLRDRRRLASSQGRWLSCATHLSAEDRCCRTGPEARAARRCRAGHTPERWRHSGLGQLRRCSPAGEGEAPLETDPWPSTAASSSIVHLTMSIGRSSFHCSLPSIVSASNHALHWRVATPARRASTNSFRSNCVPPGSARIWDQFGSFETQTHRRLSSEGHSAEDLRNLPINEVMRHMRGWLEAQQSTRSFRFHK